MMEVMAEVATPMVLPVGISLLAYRKKIWSAYSTFKNKLKPTNFYKLRHTPGFEDTREEDSCYDLHSGLDSFPALTTYG